MAEFVSCGKIMSMEAICKNCEASLSPEFDYCPKCSQKAKFHRLSLHEVFHEGVHYFTHADKGIFQLLRDLALKNGVVAREYVEGKRKKYFPPLNFFLLVAGIFVLFVTDFHHDEMPAVQIPESLSQIQNPQKREQAVAVYERQINVTPFMNKYSNVLAIIALPLIAFFFWLFYKKAGYNYTEHLVANMYMAGFCLVLSAVLIVPAEKFLGISGKMTGLLNFVMELVYFTPFYYHFLNKTTKAQFAKAFFVSFIAISSWFVVSFIFVGIYVATGFWGIFG